MSGSKYAPPLGSAFFDRTDRAPADKTAALVVSRGERHNNTPKVVNEHWDYPPPMKRPPKHAPQLVGMRCGRLTVVGMHATRLGAWVVRCDCGDYETRRAKAIRNQNNHGDRCTLCRNAAFQRKNYEYKTYGRELDIRTL